MSCMGDTVEAWVRRHQLVILLIVMVCAAFLYSQTFYTELVGTDDTTYLVVARALASGQGLHWINVAGQPPMTFQPPGYPLLLALGAGLFPHLPGLTASAQAVGALSALAFIPIIYLVLVQMMNLSPVSALLITVWMALSTQTVDLATQKIMSDPAYVVFSLIAIWAIERYRRSQKTFDIWLGLSAAAVAWVATLRTAGLPLLPAAVLYLLFRRQVRQAVALAALACLLLLPWALWTAQQGATPYFGLYGEQLRQTHWLTDPRPISGPGALAGRVVGNAWEHVRMSLGYALFPTLNGPNVRGWMETHGLGWSAWGVGLVIGVLALAGYLRSLRRGLPLISLYVLFYLGLVLLPPWVNTRNVYPVYPFLLGFAASGAEGLMMQWKPRFRQWSLWGTWAVFALMILSSLVSVRHQVAVAHQFRAAGRSLWSVSDWAMPEAAAWIRDNTSPEALVFYQSTQKMFLYTDRQTASSVGALPYQLMQLDPEELLSRIRRDIEYVATVDQKDGFPEVAARIAADPAHFVPVFRTSAQPTVTVYQVLK